MGIAMLAQYFAVSTLIVMFAGSLAAAISFALEHLVEK